MYTCVIPYVHVCKAGDKTQESVLLSCHVGFKDWTQVVTLSCKLPYPLSQLLMPICTEVFLVLWPNRSNRLDSSNLFPFPKHIYLFLNFFLNYNKAAITQNMAPQLFLRVQFSSMKKHHVYCPSPELLSSYKTKPKLCSIQHWLPIHHLSKTLALQPSASTNSTLHPRSRILTQFLVW